MTAEQRESRSGRKSAAGQHLLDRRTGTCTCSGGQGHTGRFIADDKGQRCLSLGRRCCQALASERQKGSQISRGRHGRRRWKWLMVG